MTRMLLATLGSALTVGLASAAPAQTFSCTNADFQIACEKGKCSASDGFTPMSFEIDVRRRTMSACAYSGCWEGRAEHLIATSKHVVASATRLKPNSAELGPAAAVVAVDRGASSGVASAFGFQLPVTCTRAR